jgi:hypothetical protein
MPPCDALYELSLPSRVQPERPLFPNRIVGHAFTVEDTPSARFDTQESGSVHTGIQSGRPSTRCLYLLHRLPAVGHFGELTANSAKAHGCVGAVLTATCVH